MEDVVVEVRLGGQSVQCPPVIFANPVNEYGRELCSFGILLLVVEKDLKAVRRTIQYIGRKDVPERGLPDRQKPPRVVRQ